jgi:hypothetical protein
MSKTRTLELYPPQLRQACGGGWSNLRNFQDRDVMVWSVFSKT